jgi:hypothetical protein
MNQDLEAQNNANPTNASASTGKPPRRRFAKLSGADLVAFPGALPQPEKKAPEPGITYSIEFNLPVTAPLGLATELVQVFGFVDQLGIQAKVKGIGAVTAVNVVDGNSEVVLKLSTTGEQPNHGTPAANAFATLKDYLESAPQLITGPAGTPASWKAKVNNTTIAEGCY